MFTLTHIEIAHSKVQSGADFPKYIQELKAMGVKAFETWVKDSCTTYFGTDGFTTSSAPKYEELTIAQISHPEHFKHSLKIHQEGATDYFTFCQHCAETGIEKWIVDLDQMTCTYYDPAGNAILVERVPEI